MRMGEHLKAVFACDRHERRAGGPAVRMAKAVGAETATMIGPLIAADFCTISTETRLVTRELIEGVVALACQAKADGKVLQILRRRHRLPRATWY